MTPDARPSFEEVYLDLAASIARRSTCLRVGSGGVPMAVGCVITSTDHRRVLAVGYNGNAAGLENACDDPLAVGACGCFLAGTRVRAAGVSRAYRRRYVGDVLRIVTTHGEFTVTPNHPVLAPFRGWVAAEEIREGDDLVHPHGDERVALGSPHDQHDVPIEEVFESLLVAGRAVRRAGARHDFHGDGLVGEDVDVVAAAGPLGSDGDAFALERAQERLLVGPDAVEALLGRQGAVVGTLDPAVASRTSGDRGCAQRLREDARLRKPLFDCCAAYPVRPSKFLRGGAGAVALHELPNGQRQHPLSLVSAEVLGDAAKDAALPEAALDGGVRHPDRTGDLHDGLTPLVATHKVLHIERKAWAGHVFNLQTANGWYVAEGTIAKNCIHAEENAVISCQEPRATPKYVYTTHQPCVACAKRLIQLGGVVRVMSRIPYRIRRSIDLFAAVGIEYVELGAR